MTTIYHSILEKAVNVENLRVTWHDIPDENGEIQTEQYVEFEVIGSNRTWPDQLPYNKFVVNNPLVNLSD